MVHFEGHNAFDGLHSSLIVHFCWLPKRLLSIQHARVATLKVDSRVESTLLFLHGQKKRMHLFCSCLLIFLCLLFKILLCAFNHLNITTLCNTCLILVLRGLLLLFIHFIGDWIVAQFWGSLRSLWGENPGGKWIFRGRNSFPHLLEILLYFWELILHIHVAFLWISNPLTLPFLCFVALHAGRCSYLF